jgi:predicted nucleic acid-binding protein
VNEAVLDASVVLKWFHADGEGHVEIARELRAQFEAGELRVLAPSLLWLELLNVAARRWSWSQSQLEQLAVTTEQVGFELLEPELSSGRCLRHDTRPINLEAANASTASSSPDATNVSPQRSPAQPSEPRSNAWETPD